MAPAAASLGSSDLQALQLDVLQRSQELPSLDDLTGVDDQSKALAAVALVFCVLTLVPSPVETVPLAQNANPFAF